MNKACVEGIMLLSQYNALDTDYVFSFLQNVFETNM